MNLAYAAGIFDGEGCVNFARCRNYTYIRVYITNTNLELLEDFQAKWGGDINPLTKRKRNWKQGYQWRIAGTKAVNFLAEIEPWLRVKWKQAIVAFAWHALRPGSGRGHGIDVEALDLLRRQLKWLNTRGPQKETEPILCLI